MSHTVTRRQAIALATGGTLATRLPGSAVAQTALRAHTAAPGSSSFIFMTTAQTIVQKHVGVQMNVTTGMAATRSTLDATRDQVDIYISSPAINHYMLERQEMFKDMADAPEAFKAKVRGIMNFPLGPYHIIVYESSGITDLKQIKGKKVFLGPPGGAATVVALAIVEGATGYKPGVDYQQARFDWNSGNQAFQDKQVDVAVIPTELPSPAIAQFALLDKIRLLGIPEESLTSEPMKKILAIPGRTMTDIPAGIYGANQVNTGPTQAVGSWVGISTRTGLDADLVYKVTKAIFDNIADIHAAAPFMKFITRETALLQMNAPLHVGALRYYREIGVQIDPALIPPEAK
jgi:uncharacterized protein